MKIKNEQGEEIEVFTAEEAQAQAEEAAKTASEKAAADAVEKYKQENPDVSADLKKAQTEAADAQKKLDEALAAAEGNETEQIKRLRQERDEAKSKADSVETDFETKFNQFRQEIIGDTKNELLDQFAKDDVELRKKIELEFDNYRPNATSKADLKERMDKAYLLATGNKPSPNPLDGSASGGSRGNGSPAGGAGENEPSENAKAIGAVLGITDADREVKKELDKVQDQARAIGTLPPKNK